MSEISFLIEKLIAAGVDPVTAAEVVTRASIFGVVNAPRQRSAGAIRQERYRRNKALQVTQSDASSGLPLEQSSPTPPETQTPSLIQKDIPPKGGISKKVSLPPESSLSPESPIVADCKKSTKTAKRGSRIPDDWCLGPMELTAAAEVGLAASLIAIEGAKFRDYWLAKTGKDATKADWMATWRNWCRRAAENAKRFPSKPLDKPKFRNGFAELLYDMNAEQQSFYDDEPDRNATPEIISTDHHKPRNFGACGPDIRDAGSRSWEPFVVDFQGCRTAA